MEILGSTQYVDFSKQKDKWYQLEVINQWDFKTKSICFRYSGNTLISYSLKLYTPTGGNICKKEEVEDITKEMENTLINNGYTL